MDKKTQKEFIREEMARTLLNPAKFDRSEFPNLWNLSSAHFYSQLPIPQQSKPPEFVFLKDYEFNGYTEKVMAISEWNMVWEVGHLRSSFFWQRLPDDLAWLKDFDGTNLYLVPENKEMPYITYGPFLHILPMKTRQKFGLPLITKGQWPFLLDHNRVVNGHIIKRNFIGQLSKAFAYHVWPILDRQNKLSAFSSTDSISLLAHNLKFWMPFLYSAVEERLKDFERIKPESQEQIEKIKNLQKQYPDIDIKLPLTGGTIWSGEDDAWEMTNSIVEKADAGGKLREIIQAIKTNRVQDDFSHKWSYAKEDFEQKLYSKRNKISVNFVEVDEATPIHSSSTEIDEDILWDDLISVVDQKERKVIICLRKGITKHKEISEILGYKNHSPVTKMLKKIRDKAKLVLDI